MPFFVPTRLVRFDYFRTSRVEDEEAKPYQDDMNFAFFAVNFNYSKTDYNELTPREVKFILKAYETKTVRDSTLIRDCVYNAVNNALRKKGKAFKKLWKKLPQVMSDEEYEESVNAVLETEKKEGKSWVDELRRREKNG